MSANVRSLVAWLLPFFVSAALSLGATVALMSVSSASSQPGPAGDRAGAAGALLFMICAFWGFVMSMVTVILAKVLRRGPPGNILLRIGLSVVGGAVIGGLAPDAGAVFTVIFWPLLCGVPVLVSWTWRSGPAVREDSKSSLAMGCIGGAHPS